MISQKNSIEAAIRHIQTSVDIDPWAMELAVEALKAQIDKGINVPNNDDTIYRQAAIDAIDDIGSVDTYADRVYAKGIMRMLPSAHPEPCEDAVSRKLMYELGATCIARRDENGKLVALGRLDMLPSAQPNLQPTCNNLATDTISRQEAIDIVRKLSVKEVTPAYMLIDKTDAMTELMMLPSAQPDNRLSKIADLVEGTIDHFDLDDAMDLLYQIKEVLK